MNAKPIRLLVVDSEPGGMSELHSLLEQIPDVEMAGIAHSQRMAFRQVESVKPDFMLVDLMLPGLRSIDLISRISATHPDIRILALSPGDIPHDRVILSIRAGALGRVNALKTRQ